jgi:hypothetical protein
MQTVMLRFSLIDDDVLDAAVAQYRAARRPWYLRWPFLGLLVAIGVVSLAVLVGPLTAGRVPSATVAVPILLIIVPLVYANPRLLYRTTVRRLMRSNPTLSLPMTVTVSQAGVSTASAVGETSSHWTQYPYHTETERSFFLFASDRLGGVVQILPKRGLSIVDPEPLRSLLAAHSQRLG